MNYKISKETFDSLYDVNIPKVKYDLIISSINKRFTEICNFIIKHNNLDVNYFDYGNCCDQESGYFDIAIYKKDIATGYSFARNYKSFYYENSFPTRFLWEDCEYEIIRKEKKYIEDKINRSEKRKLKSKERKDRYKLLQASIMKKLTKEELGAIKFK